MHGQLGTELQGQEEEKEDFFHVNERSLIEITIYRKEKESGVKIRKRAAENILLICQNNITANSSYSATCNKIQVFAFFCSHIALINRTYSYSSSNTPK